VLLFLHCHHRWPKAHRLLKCYYLTSQMFSAFCGWLFGRWPAFCLFCFFCFLSFSLFVYWFPSLGQRLILCTAQTHHSNSSSSIKVGRLFINITTSSVIHQETSALRIVFICTGDEGERLYKFCIATWKTIKSFVVFIDSSCFLFGSKTQRRKV
jgi:FlaA1/EpsC-like NDP-sugar epimerase